METDPNLITQIYEYLKNAATESDFAKGGILIFTLTSLGFLARYGSVWGYRWILKRFTVSIDADSNDQIYTVLCNWITHSEYGKRTRRLRAKSHDQGLAIAAPTPKQKTHFVPSEGTHIFKWQTHWIILEHSREKEGLGSIIGKLSFKIAPASREVAGKLIQEAQELWDSMFCPTMIKVARYGGWQVLDEAPRRSWDTVFLHKYVEWVLRQDLEQFIDSKEFYKKIGKPWRRCYLLYGPPGNGKSSAIAAIASELGSDIYLLDTSVVSNNQELMELVGSVPKTALLVIEDFDTIGAVERRAEEKDDQITFNGLLNALDGVASGSDRVTILTTNVMDLDQKFDEALLRPGRVDKRFLIEKPGARAISQSFSLVFDGSDLSKQYGEDAEKYQPSMAQVQNVLLQYRDPKQALENCAKDYNGSNTN